MTIDEYAQGDLLAQEALERAEEHASPDWIDAARRVVWQLIQEGEPFTTDQVWDRLDRLDVHTHEPRALGAVMRNAARAGFIENTGSYFKSARVQNHARPIPLWCVKKRTRDAA